MIGLILPSLRFRLGRLYETYWFSQSSLKYTLVFLYPGFLYWTRFKAEHQYKYHLFFADESVKPSTEKQIYKFKYGATKDGKMVYQTGDVTVSDLKKQLFAEAKNKEASSKARVGCHGRMFEDSDNLAMAVKNFCRKDSKLVFWEEPQLQV
jgi:hypothetical protein